MIWRILERRIRSAGRFLLVACRGLALEGAAALDPVGRTTFRSVRPRRVAVLGIERLEQLIAALPVLDGLASVHPEIRITVALRAALAPLVESRRSVAQVLAYPGRPDSRLLARRLRLLDADLALDLSCDDEVRFSRGAFLARVPLRVGPAGGGRDAFLTRAVRHVSDCPSRIAMHARLARAAGAGAVPARPELRVPAFELRAANGMLHHAGWTPGRALLALQPGARRPSERWPADRFARAARAIADERDAAIAVLGAPSDRDLAERVAGLAGPRAFVVPALDVRRFAAVVALADLLLSGDTGAVLLAEATGTPAVAVAGPQDPAWYGNDPPLRRILRRDGLACSPCSRRRCGPHECLLAIGPEEAAQACRDVLDAAACRSLRRVEGA